MRQARQRRGIEARSSGRRAEVWAVVWLMLRGYRILGFRLKTPQAEIDILAQKSGILAVVEVKRRTSLERALEAVTPDQRQRLMRAATTLAARRPSLAGLSVRLDLMAMAPGRWPQHVENAWPAG